MRTRGVVLVVVAGCASFSTARYEDAHLRRVESINARYQTERQRQHEYYMRLRIELESRRALLARSYNQALGREIDDQLAHVDELEAATRCTTEQARDDEIRASEQRRDAEIESARAERRARVRAAAEASPLDQGPPPEPWW